MSTGVHGLDSVLWGGLPAGRTTLVSGGPGCAKTVLALQFLCAGVQSGEPGLLISFEERAQSLRDNALSFGWDLAREEEAGRLIIIEARPNPANVFCGESRLVSLLQEVAEAAAYIGAKRIVLDGSDAFFRLFDDLAQENTQLFALQEWLVEHGLTTLLTAKLTRSQALTARHDFLEFMADCVICLRQDLDNRDSGLLLRVVKCRGSGFGRHEYPCLVTEAGLVLRPISDVAVRDQKSASRVSSGHPKLDEILSGGFRCGSSILVYGGSGSGKTTLAATFARAAVARNERVLFISFEQSEHDLLDELLSVGIDLRSANREGRFRHLAALPESTGAEEHLHRILTVVETWRPHYVIVDPISALNRLGSAAVAFSFVVRLIGACRQYGATSFMTNQRTGRLEDAPDSQLRLSSLVDTKIILRSLQIGSRVQRALIVAQARGSPHSDRLHPYAITDHGLEMGDPDEMSEKSE